MKRITVLLALALCTAAAFGQDITNTLDTGGNFYVKDSANTFLATKQSTGLTGIGPNVTNPRASLEVGGSDGLLSTGAVGSGTALNLAAGARMHWYPRKAAFRAGVAEGIYWNDAYIGNYSVAMGYYSRASGIGSTAIGHYNYATGNYTLSLGNYSRAAGQCAIAIGSSCDASGTGSMAIGTGANTNAYNGAVVITDYSFGMINTYATQDDQITMRFTGGFRLWTGVADSQYGVYMRANTSGWTSYCDRNLKENFRELDGEEVLRRIREMPVTEWNYKGTQRIRYIGPMAQDFHAAFGLGGDDSLGINTISIDGVNLAGVRALEARTRRMQAENEALRAEVRTLKERLAGIAGVKSDLAEMKRLKSELDRQMETLSAIMAQAKTPAAGN